MTIRLSRLVVPAMLAIAVPATIVLAQTQGQNQPPARTAGPSTDTLSRLQDGRIAMIKEALKLDDAQLKLWAPVEEQMRASFATRQQARAARREMREQRRAGERLSLPDRLDHASERMAKRAERMKAYAEAVRPFYASLSDYQKAVASIVLRRTGFGSRRHRSAMHRAHR